MNGLRTLVNIGSSSLPSFASRTLARSSPVALHAHARSTASESSPQALTVEERETQLANMFNSHAPIAKTFGMTLEFKDGKAWFTLPYNANLNHAGQGIHGGIYMTMLDNAGWFTSARRSLEPIWIATSEMQVHFLKNAGPNTTLKATGNIIKAGKRQDVVEAMLYNDTEELVAHATGTFMRLEGTVMPLFGQSTSKL